MSSITHELSRCCNTNRRAEKCFWFAGALIDPITGIFTQGLADLLVLDTLRHGTSLSNNILIRVHGPDPSLGGSDRGAVKGHELAKTARTANRKMLLENSKKGFFVYLDPSSSKHSWKEACYLNVYVRFGPRAYCFGSGAACAAPIHMDGRMVTIWRFVNGVGNYLFTPPVKLRFLPEEVGQKFHTDPILGGRAAYTREKISTNHLGLIGVIKQGSRGNVCERIKHNPLKSAFGAVRLVIFAFGMYYLMMMASARLENRCVFRLIS